ncbi:MAG: hypothetical protein ACLR8Y_02440 [Alistipes indistinctus]
MLYLAGAALALILTMIGVPALAFALGMLIPLEPSIRRFLVGGLDQPVAWHSGRNSERESYAARARNTDRVGLITAGVSADGGAALLTAIWGRLVASSWNATSGAEILAVVMAWPLSVISSGTVCVCSNLRPSKPNRPQMLGESS